MNVEEALRTRRSIRGFHRDRPVPDDVLRRIFTRAQQAPSWCNIQPWRVWVASGERRARLVERMLETASRGAPPDPDYEWPNQYPDHYGVLRKQCGVALYRAMGVSKDDGPARYAAWLRNYEAFDAPHVAIVGIDRRFSLYAALDVGCWLQSLLLAATEEGVATCSQASLASYSKVVHEVLDIPENVGLLFGVSLGYEDPDVGANQCRTERDELSANVTFLSAREENA